MYPFSTDHFNLTVPLQEEQFKGAPKKEYHREEIFQITSSELFYGSIKKNMAFLELGQNPYRNSFRPQVVIKWQSELDGLHIHGYYRPYLIVSIVMLTIPFAGIQIGIEINSILPFITTFVLWIAVYFGLIQLFYKLSRKSTRKKVEELLSRVV